MSAFRVREAARLVRRGGVIAYPTEAVWGLGCDPLNGDAVQRILAIKERPAEKGLILVAADYRQVLPFIVPPADEQLRPVLESWPGPATWLLPARPGLPWWINGGKAKVAVRVTAHAQTAELCQQAGTPLVSTSANASGRPPARTALEARLRCPGVDAILPSPTDGLARPTAIRDASSGELLRS